VAMAPNTATVPRMIANVLGSDGLLVIIDTSYLYTVDKKHSER